MIISASELDLRVKEITSEAVRLVEEDPANRELLEKGLSSLADWVDGLLVEEETSAVPSRLAHDELADKVGGLETR